MPAKKMIDDSQLLSLMREGLTKKEAADRLGVSPTAIGKRLKRLLPSSDSILEKYDLTEKESAFVRGKAQGLTNVQAVQSAYNVTTLKSAKSLGTELMKKPEIQQSIQEIMETEGLTRPYRIRKLKSHVDNVDPAISLKALDQSFRLDGSYAPEKHSHSIEDDIDSILFRIEGRFRKTIDVTPENEPLSGI